jgi:catechol-2,3-dioxygenase
LHHGKIILAKNSPSRGQRTLTNPLYLRFFVALFMRILSVELLTDDIEATSVFYTTVLGLPLYMNDRNTLDIGAGKSRLLFRRSVNRKPVYNLAFNIPSNKIHEAAEFIGKRTDLIPSEGKSIVDFIAWNAMAFYFYDNNGNILEIIARADLHNDSNAPFSPSQLLSISEVAIVTDSVSQTSGFIKAATDVGPYEKQPVHENFAALGDANGLFILSAKKRHWFPTENEAKHFPVRVKVEEKGLFRSLSF